MISDAFKQFIVYYRSGCVDVSCMLTVIDWVAHFESDIIFYTWLYCEPLVAMASTTFFEKEGTGNNNLNKYGRVPVSPQKYFVTSISNWYSWETNIWLIANVRFFAFTFTFDFLHKNKTLMSSKNINQKIQWNRQLKSFLIFNLAIHWTSCFQVYIHIGYFLIKKKVIRKRKLKVQLNNQ